MMDRPRQPGDKAQSERLQPSTVEYAMTYQAPFTKRNREQDYAMVWAVLDSEKVSGKGGEE